MLPTGPKQDAMVPPCEGLALCVESTVPTGVAAETLRVAGAGIEYVTGPKTFTIPE
ncbi:hypothetical protein GCM10010872_09860 [Dyella flava]|nr:hypothetical protein GCM10010872_09860 [Dyella flava]